MRTTFWWYLFILFWRYGCIHSDSFSPSKRIEGIIDDVRQLMDLSPLLHTHRKRKNTFGHICGIYVYVSSIKTVEYYVCTLYQLLLKKGMMCSEYPDGYFLLVLLDFLARRIWRIGKKIEKKKTHPHRAGRGWWISFSLSILSLPSGEKTAGLALL